MSRFEETAALLKGIAHYERLYDNWNVFLDQHARAEVDQSSFFSEEWDGVLSRHVSPSLAEACATRGIPLVDLGPGPIYPGTLKVRPDDEALGRMGAQHLTEQGYRNLAFVGFASELESHLRKEGFAAAARAAGATHEVLQLQPAPERTPENHLQQVEALRNWVRHLPKPIGIMGCNDLLASQVLEAARSAQLFVPEDVAVLGAEDDAAVCNLVSPTLSSIALDAFQTGYIAAQTLSRSMRGETHPEPHVRVKLAGVVARQSTNALVIPDKPVVNALTYIREHACEGINVNQVLSRVFVSRSYLEKKFRLYLGRSPQAEIRRVQLRRVCELLERTDYPIKRIAMMSGFRYMEHMCLAFKRAMGETPGGYRARMSR